MSRIFISYKREDKDKVFPLKDKIESATGEKCWIDLDGIESDAHFVNVIIRAIDEADIFLFMYSKRHSKLKDYEKDYTVRELNYAQEEGKRIVFVNLDHTPLTKWFKFMFSSKQQVDATSEDAFNHLLQDINKWFGNKFSSETIRIGGSNDDSHNGNHTLRGLFQLINRSKLPVWLKKSLKAIIYLVIFIAIVIFILGFFLFVELIKPKNEKTNTPSDIDSVYTDTIHNIPDISDTIARDSLQLRTQPLDFPNEDNIKHLLQQFADFCSENDYEGLESVYAPEVLRYHDLKKTTPRSQIIQRHRNYDTKSGVCAKHFNYQWNTLKITKISNSNAEVICLLDYSIYRVDETKQDEFLLEQHLVINKDYKIVSIYDIPQKNKQEKDR